MANLALAVNILAKDNASGSLKKVGDEAEKTHKKFATMGAALAGGAIGGAVVEFGKKAVDAAVEGEGAHARLAQAIKNTGGSMEELEPKVDKLSQRFAKLGFTNDEVEAALAQMTTSLGSPAKAMGAMGLAADLARFKHIGLADASLTVAKAMEGQLRPLKQLGIDLPVAAGGAKAVAQAHQQLAVATEKANTFLAMHKDAVNANSKFHGTYMQMLDKVHAAQARVNASQGAAKSITDALAKAVGGQASSAANTYAGRIAAMHAEFENFQEQVGQKLLPILLKLMNNLASMASFVERNQKVIKPLVVVLGTMVGVSIAVNKAMAIGSALKATWIALTGGQVAATEAATGAQVGLNAAMDANPIGIVIVAVAALAAGMIYAYKHSETFRRIVNGAFSAIGKAAVWLKDVAVGAIKFLVNIWLTELGLLVHGAAWAFGWIPGIGPKLKAAAREFDKFKNAVNASLDAIKSHKTISVDIGAVAGGRASDALLNAHGTFRPTVAPPAPVARTVPHGAAPIVHLQANLQVDGRTLAQVNSTHTAAAVRRGSIPAVISR